MDRVKAPHEILPVLALYAQRLPAPSARGGGGGGGGGGGSIRIRRYYRGTCSVFQLHLHVNSNQQHINTRRAHFPPLSLFLYIYMYIVYDDVMYSMT